MRRGGIVGLGGLLILAMSVAACVRFELESDSVIATSVDCPDGPPFSDFTDEWVVVA
ncbi:hypothetical protein [Pseudarthrobacter sp. fls2-241-R2A-168]|uniref:hypothetical protein n=1 Tax=Pseudarthrobacter sp. fls2-241-R2A-168 TaxID=3040304 RepID=UPI00255497B0|nr:hypothetical protein [Pseudarthrobacter sp. fls2-241-R2A-168]